MTWRIKAVLEALSGIQFSEPLKSVNGSFSANRTDSEFRLSDYEICPLNEKCRDFLITGRKLSPSTVDLFSPFINSVAYIADGKRYYNTSFPYRVPETPTYATSRCGITGIRDTVLEETRWMRAGWCLSIGSRGTSSSYISLSRP